MDCKMGPPGLCHIPPGVVQCINWATVHANQVNIHQGICKALGLIQGKLSLGTTPALPFEILLPGTNLTSDKETSSSFAQIFCFLGVPEKNKDHAEH